MIIILSDTFGVPMAYGNKSWGVEKGALKSFYMEWGSVAASQGQIQLELTEKVT
jgi:hypothetical protein